MKTLGMQPLMRNGLNYKKTIVLFGLHVSDRGEVTVPKQPPKPNADQETIARRRLNAKTPADAAAALAAPRRRLIGKTAA